jgi:hypothetical protein
VVKRATLAAMAALGCASGPPLRSEAPHAASDVSLAVDLQGLDAARVGGGLIVEARAVSAAPVAVERIALGAAAVPACAEPATPASALLLDGAPAWGRPVPVVGAHHLRLEMPWGPGLRTALDGEAVIDVAYVRAGQHACLRVPLVAAGDGDEWRPRPRLMTGVRVGGPRITVGLRAGAWLGPVLAAAEGAGSPDRASVAAFAQAPLIGSIGLQLGGMGWWDLAGTDRARGSFRSGPRGAIQLISDIQRERLGGRRIGMGCLDVAIARWLAAGGEAARTEISIDLSWWWNPGVPDLGP